jgi:hypothetical protein
VWPRLRATFGPALVGLVGGAVAGLAALPSVAPLCRNIAATYDKYPNLQRPWLAVSLELPAWLVVVAALIGLAAPVAMGAAAIWLVRPRDVWDDLAAGVTTGLAATLSAFASCLGWPVVLALVVVPSISDLTLLGNTVGEAAPAGHLSQPLVQRYPDLAEVEAGHRGSIFVSRIISDQVAGSISGVWLGTFFALLTAGSLALSGALAAGQLLRRGDCLRAAVLPYLEITLPLTVTVALVAGAVLWPVWNTLLGANPFPVSPLALVGLVGVTPLMIAGALYRWPWLPRLCLAFTWLILLTQSRPGSLSWLPLVAVALTGVLLARLYRARRPIIAGP